MPAASVVVALDLPHPVASEFVEIEIVAASGFFLGFVHFGNYLFLIRPTMNLVIHTSPLSRTRFYRNSGSMNNY